MRIICLIVTSGADDALRTTCVKLESCVSVHTRIGRVDVLLSLDIAKHPCAWHAARRALFWGAMTRVFSHNYFTSVGGTSVEPALSPVQDKHFCCPSNSEKVHTTRKSQSVIKTSSWLSGRVQRVKRL